MKPSQYPEYDLFLYKLIDHLASFNKRQYMEHCYVSLEGNIGSGKSTLLEYAKSYSSLLASSTVFEFFCLNKETILEDQVTQLYKYGIELTKNKMHPKNRRNRKVIMDLKDRISRHEYNLYQKEVRFNYFEYDSLRKRMLLRNKFIVCLSDRDLIGHYAFMVMTYLRGFVSYKHLLFYEKEAGIDRQHKIFPRQPEKYEIIIHIFRPVNECYDNIQNRGNDSDKILRQDDLYLYQYAMFMVYKHFSLFETHGVYIYSFSQERESSNYSCFSFTDYVEPQLTRNRYYKVFGTKNYEKYSENEIYAFYTYYQEGTPRVFIGNGPTIKGIKN